ncbi:hypothetical protein JR316_0011153 [Psilocybe cubensis]|uniref:Uncharacterized protein n=2 Tax=Psilocybe cubensis TaxID=181762 RepID=A0ACB8GNS8_PSICU|nr:hypothetical protein JR316_0011153 [Psilocybe cubensis]KAH9477234.1 hypothetical protein JR316_0011153 [Psilocybe cubensis]
MADYVAPSIAQSLRSESDLEGFLRHANKVLLDNAQVALAFRATAGVLKAAIRDDCSKHMVLRKELKKKGSQLDHVFEVQYFAATFLHTLAEHICANPNFKPDVTDISFAVLLVNSQANLCPLGIFEHKFKTAFFRAAQTKKFKDPENLEDNLSNLLGYLKSYGAIFQKFLEDIKQDIVNYPHYSFKKLFIDNLLETPWCRPDDWDAILTDARLHQTPFSKNMTMKNYIPQSWWDDNTYFKGVAKQIVGGETEDEYITSAQQVECYNPNGLNENVTIYKDVIPEQYLALLGLVKENTWLE